VTEVNPPKKYVDMYVFHSPMFVLEDFVLEDNFETMMKESGCLLLSKEIISTKDLLAR
jgi:hypothetical protein